MYYYDYYFLVLIGVILCLYASAKVKVTFGKYSKVASRSGYTGAQVAQIMLDKAGISDVTVKRVAGNLTDHYNPKTLELCLSDQVYGARSIAAIGVAAHECGHAIQHFNGYAPLNWRSALVPVANIGSNVSIPMILIGALLNSNTGDIFILLGILLFSFGVLFQVVTLPVEFNASKRALVQLDSYQILREDELRKAKKVLSAAALTYVAGAISMMLQLLRLVLIFGRRSD